MDMKKQRIPKRLERSHFNDEVTQNLEGRSVTLCGWIERLRIVGKLIFIVLRDKTGLVQITLHKKTAPNIFEDVKGLNPETAAIVQGLVKKETQAPRGVEIVPDFILPIGPAQSGIPLDVTGKTPADLSTRLDYRVLDLRKPRVQSIFKIQSTITQACHEFFNANGFIEIHTPKLVAEATEGGANIFQVEYFNRKAYLAQSPQLYKQLLLLSGFDKVYEIAPVYRAEPHKTTRHINEYISIDGEISWINDHHDVMDIHEKLIKHILQNVNRKNQPQLEQFQVQIKLPSKIPKITYGESLELLNSRKISLSPGEDLTPQAERELGNYVMEKFHSAFCFIIDYPSNIRPFYAKTNQEKPELTNTFDLLHQGVEITTGGQRAHIYEDIIAGLKKKELKTDGFEFYLEPFKFGAPPHGGFGLGLERLTMTLLNLTNIREATLFPRDTTRLTP
jgi:aspartyl-tRNA synthetase